MVGVRVGGIDPVFRTYSHFGLVLGGLKRCQGKQVLSYKRLLLLREHDKADPATAKPQLVLGVKDLVHENSGQACGRIQKIEIPPLQIPLVGRARLESGEVITIVGGRDRGGKAGRLVLQARLVIS